MTRLTKGFTVLELIIVIAVVGIIIGVVVGPLAAFRQRQALQNTTNSIVSALSDARAKTFAALSDNAYGVHFETTEATVFAGPTYMGTASTNQIYSFDPSIEVAWDLIGGGSSVLFERLTGTTAQHGTITVRIPGGASNTITITSLGSVSKE